jgi:hypothetical protein
VSRTLGTGLIKIDTSLSGCFDVKCKVPFTGSWRLLLDSCLLVWYNYDIAGPVDVIVVCGTNCHDKRGMKLPITQLIYLPHT